MSMIELIAALCELLKELLASPESRTVRTGSEECRPRSEPGVRTPGPVVDGVGLEGVFERHVAEQHAGQALVGGES